VLAWSAAAQQQGPTARPFAIAAHRYAFAPERLEAPEFMAEAAYALCTGDPAKLTGRITYARPLLDELGTKL